MDTNFTTDEILSFYNIFKDILASREYQSNQDFINIIQIKVAGTNRKEYFSSLKKNLWVHELDKDSIEKASNEMKVNLGIQEPTMQKTFQFTP